MRLIFRKETAPEQSLELRQGITRLGRREDNDFQIDDPTVSSIHCEIRVEGDSVVVRDLGSSNGTFINGQQIRQHSLELGETLALGDVEMVLEKSPIVVSIPIFNEPTPVAPVALPDGSEACTNHPGTPAMQRCTHCKRVFCNVCVHHLRRVGGKSIDLCPSCSNRCELLPGAIKPRKKSLFSRLQETLRLTFKR
ncbi:MAG: FHA domain-containing protein [Verrucomicrobia subdivision 3 bacterium]|nr:FHA domain-containing protein [Limisphaerales bacterium]